MDHIRIFQCFVHGAVHDQFIVMMINRGTDEFCLFFVCQTEFSQDLPCKIRSLMRMVIIRTRLIGMQIMQHSRHREKLRVQSALLRDHGCSKRNPVQMRDRSGAFIDILHAVNLCVHIISEIF